MKRLLWIGIAVAAMVAVGCGENQSPPTAMDRVPPPAASTFAPPAGATAAASPAVGRSAANGGVSAPVPPAGAQWTIFCASFNGPDHVLIAAQAKQDLLAQSRLTDWYIIHHDDDSILYYGYYTALNTPRAKADKRAVDALTRPNGDRAFTTCMFVPLASPDPAAPAAWDLANTPADMYWSLQIGAFCRTADRKERAVEAVREARKAGYEAYYYHGESISSVCIGAWPRTAVRQQAGGAVAHNDDPNVPVLVSSVPIPDDMVPKIHDDQGRPIPVMSPHLVVDDPTLAKAIAEFPEHAVNGATMVQRDKNGNPVPSQSFLVIIPHNKAAPRDVDNPEAAQPGAAPATPAPADGSDSTLGKLRTIGDH